MPFNLSQIFGGWRRKESKGRSKARGTADEISRRGRAPEAAKAAEGRVKEISDATPRVASVKNKSELAWKLIIAPHISEKSTMLGDGRYVFKVSGSANKPSLRQAIEGRYGVAVQSINILAARNKKRRRGVILGIKPGFKKAIVALKAGQTISEF
ncbi:MAG: 50S ribosomal protein L23 [Candidatus Giovannonibacteria bacterium]|nr:50S ribosomal protein L23 [Candidatus Giovannonibacteria bacterium]